MRTCAVVAVVLLGACADPTELLLRVRVDPALADLVGSEIDTLRIRSQPLSAAADEFYLTTSVSLCNLPGRVDCRPQMYAEPDYDGALSFPIRFLLQPGNRSEDEEVRVQVEALKGSTVRLADGLRFRFARERRLWLEITLYADCLDAFECERLDLACSQNRVCTPAIPTTVALPGEVSDDFGARGDFALGDPFDLAPSCGHKGDVCCASDCDPGLACTMGFCTSPGATCGEDPLPCCGGTMCVTGNLCDNGAKQCVRCGKNGKPACAGACEPGLIAVSGVCVPCGAGSGGAPQPCCTGGGCNTGYVCSTASGLVCAPCGHPGEPCCVGAVPCVNGTCVSMAAHISRPGGGIAQPALSMTSTCQ